MNATREPPSKSGEPGPGPVGPHDIRTETPPPARIAALVRSLARGGQLLTPTMTLDIAGIMLTGSSVLSHSDLAREARLHRSTVRDQRRAYGGLAYVDPDAPRLLYVPGISAQRPSFVTLVEPDGHRYGPLGAHVKNDALPAGAYVKNDGPEDSPPSLPGVDAWVPRMGGGPRSGSDREAPRRTAKDSEGHPAGYQPGYQRAEGPGPGCLEPARIGLDPVGEPVGEPVGNPPAGGAPHPPSHTRVSRPSFGGGSFVSSRGTPGGADGVGSVAASESRAEPSRPSPRSGRHRATSWNERVGARRPRTADRGPQSPPTRDTVDGRALARLARGLLGEARSLGVLEHADAYASPWYVGAGLWLLRARLGGLDRAAMAVRLGLLRLERQRAELPDSRPRFPGRAVAFFSRPRHAAAQSWFCDGLPTGIEPGWKADDWVPMPDWSEVPGWTPLEPVAELTLGPSDPDPAELGRRRAAQLAEHPAADGEHREYEARLALASDPSGPGSRALQALLYREPTPWMEHRLEGWGPSWLGRVLDWRTAAQRGSDHARARLREVDDGAGLFDRALVLARRSWARGGSADWFTA